MSYFGNTTPRTVAGMAERMDGANILLRRWLGCWIDLLAIGLLFFLPALAFQPRSNEIVQGLLGLTMLLLVLAYFPLTETLWGRSLGKLVTGLVVVDANGDKPAFWRVLLRTLLRLFEVNPLLLGGIPAGIAVIATKHKQRLGDLAAGTYVIPVKDLESVRKGSTTAAASVFE